MIDHDGLSLAIVDIGLPDMRGDALARDIRQRAPDMPIIIASGYDGAEIRRSFAGDPAMAVLSKPYSERDLRAAIGSLGITVEA